MSGFVHLHCHSVWSLRDGAIPAEALPLLAQACGQEAVAMTDHDALTGAVRFSQACRKAGVKPIYGAELTLSNNTHVTAIARDKAGYGNLCRLISHAHLSNQRDHPATTLDAIAERAEGLFILSGCERSEVAQRAGAGDLRGAEAVARRWRDAIGDGYRIEVFDHRTYGSRMWRDRLLGVARNTGIRAVATNDVHYAGRRDAITHELLHAIKDIVPLSQTQALRPNNEYGFKPSDEMRALFADVPEVADETLRIADQCEYDLDLGGYHMPSFGVGGGKSAGGRKDGETGVGGGEGGGLLARRCYHGAIERYGTVTREIEDRLQHELSTIFHLGWAAFFILVADITDHVRKVMGVRCACRGSAAGSLVCYVLGISDVDPVRYDLLFERFMNARREELPDIDVDVESHRREDVLGYILDTYGAEQTAICCMVDTYRARGAIREVGKALGLPTEEIDAVAKAFPHIRARDIDRAIDRLPELSGSNLNSGQLDRLFELCMTIDGFPRHLALHPSGVVLSSTDLADRVPMQESFNGFTMLQADKDDVEALGLVKLDVLGVRMFSTITHAVSEIARAEDEKVDLDSLPHDDPATYELIRTSRTLGCFQIESPGQRELLARYQPTRFEDLIIDISLFRPGPVRSDMVSPFLDRRHGFAETYYHHPALEPILAETYGVVVFHEQVIRVIAAATGCSLADADYVRRHLEPDAESLAEWFKAATLANGFTKSQTDALWNEVFAFAAFGFCKSHAAAFALPTYISAWLKAHHPAAFLAGVLTHDPGMYPRRLIVADARQMNIPILPIDVNLSDAVYRVESVPLGDGGGAATIPQDRKALRVPTGNVSSPPPQLDQPDGSDTFPEGDLKALGAGGIVAEPPGHQPAHKLGIRLALSEVRGITADEMNSVIGGQPFTSLEDFWRRADVSRPVIENLVHVGALDSLQRKRSRRELMWRLVELASKPAPGRVSVAGGASQLALDVSVEVGESLLGLPGYSALEETQAEIEVTGIDARHHIVDHYVPLLRELGCVPAAELGGLRNNTEVWVAGVKVASQTPQIRSGQRIIFVTLDDPTGPIDVTVFERVQARCARTVFHSWLLLVRGIVRKRGGASRFFETDPTNVGITVVVDEVFDLSELLADRKAGRSLASALGRQRKLQAMGAAVKVDDAPSGRLWHASGGSAGR